MIKVNLVCVGKVKEKYFAEGIAEYSKRLSRFCEFNIVELAEENINKPSSQEKLILISKEGEKILANLKGYVVVCAIEGKKFSSEKLASTIKETALKGGVITFVIGGSYGVSDKVKEKADMLLSASDMTFPHTMFRLMMTEQIYRAFTIIEGTAYHK